MYHRLLILVLGMMIGYIAGLYYPYRVPNGLNQDISTQICQTDGDIQGCHIDPQTGNNMIQKAFSGTFV